MNYGHLALELHFFPNFNFFNGISDSQSYQTSNRQCRKKYNEKTKKNKNKYFKKNLTLKLRT